MCRYPRFSSASPTPTAVLAILVTTATATAQPPITIVPDLQDKILTANWIADFIVEGDNDFYDGLPHGLYFRALGGVRVRRRRHNRT